MDIDHDDERRTRFAAHNALVGRSVRVRQRREQTFVSGVLFGVDPESGDVALVVPSSPPTASVAVKIILGHAVHSVELDPTMSDLTLESLGADTLGHSAVEQLHRPTTLASDEECQARARRLCAFLDEHFIPHASIASGDKAIAVLGGAATLRFPFDADSIECVNEQILLRLRTLLSAFQQS